MQDFDWNIILSLYQTRSISQSAEQLYLSQPALTKRLRNIERELNCNIVVRSHSGITFTPQGEQLVQHAEKIAAELVLLRDDILKYQDGADGTLNIGVPYSYVRFVLPELLAVYNSRYPNVIVNITTALSDRLVQELREGSMDLCFARFDVDDRSFRREEVSEDQIYAVYHEAFTLQEMESLPYIEYNKNDPTNEAYDCWWKENFTGQPRLRMRVPNGDACLSMIQKGLGYGVFCDKSYFEQDPTLTAIPLLMKDGTYFTRKTWMVWTGEEQEHPCRDHFMEVAREYFHKNEK